MALKLKIKGMVVIFNRNDLGNGSRDKKIGDICIRDISSNEGSLYIADTVVFIDGLLFKVLKHNGPYAVEKVYFLDTLGDFVSRGDKNIYL